MSATVRINDVPYSYDAEAEAGIFLSSGERWWGTRIKWRRGTAGKWNRALFVDLHPCDYDAVHAAITTYLADKVGLASPFDPPEAHTP